MQPNDANDINDNSKHQANQNLISSVPIGENESFLLDMVYKCLRGKGVRMINSNYSSSNSNIQSNRIREKENSIETHWSDDDIPAVPVTGSNTPILPTVNRSSSSKTAHLPRTMAINHFNMGRGNGVSHIKHNVDATNKMQQQIFHRIQQQHNGAFANNTMITLRNNGSIVGLNRANFIGNIGTIANAINAGGVNSVNSPVKTTIANVVTAPTVTVNNTQQTFR